MYVPLELLKDFGHTNAKENQRVLLPDARPGSSAEWQILEFPDVISGEFFPAFRAEVVLIREDGTAVVRVLDTVSEGPAFRYTVRLDGTICIDIYEGYR